VQYIVSQTHYNTETEHKPGGTAIWINPLLSRHISGKLQDLLGRWTGVKLRTKSGNILILSIYQPPTGESSKGSISVISQQKRWILDQQQHNNTNQSQLTEITDSMVCKRFRNDLNRLIAEQQKLGFQIIIGGDFNEHNTTNSVLTDIQETHYLQNAMEKHNLHNQETYKHSHHILDKMFCAHKFYHRLSNAKLMGYHTPIHTDHQPLSAHFQLHATPSTQINSSARKLISSNMTIVTKYLQYKYNRMLTERLFDRIEQFSKGPVNKEEADSIDTTIIQISLDAEKKIRAYPDNGWNTQIPKLKKALNEINHRIKTILKTTKHTKSQIQEAIQQKKQVIRQFKVQQNQGYQIRHEEMQLKIEKLATEKEKNKKLIIHLKRMLYLEKKKLTFRKIKYQTKDNFQTPTRLQIQQQDGSIEEITNIEDIAQKVSQYNMTHYSQAQDTPLAQYDNSEEFFQTAQETTTDPTIRDILGKLAQNLFQSQLKEIPDMITEVEWKKKILKWPENTTTSPSGFHLGHYKALYKPHKWYFEETGDKKQKMDSKQQQMAQANLQFINTLLKSGISLHRWTTAHSIVLFKDKNNQLLNRIRNIHIYEADYNAILKIQWSKAIHQAEKEKIIHPSQFGSRKKKTAHDPVLLEILQQELTRMTHKTYAQINYDAQACYDRIIPLLASTVSQRYGVSQNILDIFHQTTNKMKFIVKIGATVTTSVYGNDNTTPFYGTGQGSGNSPHIWTMLSSELVKIHEDMTEGAQYQDPSQSHKVSMHMTAYVDDTNSHYSCNNTQTESEIHSTLSHIASTWEKVLHVLGGKLSNTKCTYYLNRWQYSSTGHPQIIQHRPDNIKIQTTQDIITIRGLSSQEKHRTLGYHQSTEQITQHQTQLYKDKIEENISIMKKTALTYTEFNTYYTSIFTPRILYTAALSTAPSSQTKKLMEAITQPTLRKKGFHGSTPSEIAVGLKKLGGLQMLDIYAHQGAVKALQIIKLNNTQQQTGKLFRIAYQWWRYEIGIEQCPFTVTETQINLEYSNSKWFNEIWKFLHEFEISIHIKSHWPNPLREKDRYLMDIAQEQKLPTKSLRLINQCRLYLQVLTISDITNPQGTQIDISFYTWKDAHPMKTRWSKTNYPKPNKSAWTYWRSMLDTITHTNSRRLKTVLGKWREKWYKHRRIYKHYFDQGNTYQICNHICKQMGMQEDKTSKQHKLSSQAVPAIYTLTGITLKSDLLENQDNKIPIQPQVPRVFPTKVIIATDASVHSPEAAFAWIITDHKGRTITSHASKITELDISSYRAEAYGILDVIEFIQTLGDKIKEWVLYCDNEALINQLNTIQDHEEIPTEWTDSDIIANIKERIIDGGIFRHVKGHQQLTTENNTKIEVRLNILVDSMANQAIHSSMSTKSTPDKSYIQIGQKRIFKLKDIKDHCARQQFHQYQRHKYGNDLYQTINWDIYEYIASRISQSMALIKMIHSLSPTMERQHQQRLVDTANCPLCTKHVETIHHVLKCQSNPYNYVASIDEMRKRSGCKEVHKETFETLVHSIMQEIQPNTDTVPIEQVTIGWKRIIQGKITKDCQQWIAAQIRLSTNNEKQIGNLILIIIQQWKKAWEYRNDSITHDTTRQQNNNGYNKDELEYLYENKQYISTHNKGFLMTTKEEHEQKSSAQIKNWLYMHFQTMKTDIQQNTSKQHPDDNATIRSQNSIHDRAENVPSKHPDDNTIIHSKNSRQERTENVPCEAYQAPLPGPSE
jgi:Reverse transcriptase-like